MRISDWSSDVCSSDLVRAAKFGRCVTAAGRTVLAEKIDDRQRAGDGQRIAIGDLDARGFGGAGSVAGFAPDMGHQLFSLGSARSFDGARNGVRSEERGVGREGGSWC